MHEFFSLLQYNLLVVVPLRLVPTGGDSAHPGGASASTPGTTARSSLRGGERGRHSFHSAGVGGSARVGDAPGTITRR
jgi:hypothetical protein